MDEETGVGKLVVIFNYIFSIMCGVCVYVRVCMYVRVHTLCIYTHMRVYNHVCL